MSWLNTASIANLAKSALKEAQKTIDRALDIKENADNDVVSSSLRNENSKYSYGLTKNDEELLDSSTGIVLPGPTEPRLGETNLDELQRITNQANDGFNGKAGGASVFLVEKSKDVASENEVENKLNDEYCVVDEASADSLFLTSKSSSQRAVSDVDEEPILERHTRFPLSVSTSNPVSDVAFRNGACHSHILHGTSPCDMLNSTFGRGKEVTTMISDAMEDSFNSKNFGPLIGDKGETAIASSVTEVSFTPEAISENKMLADVREPSETSAASNHSIITSMDVIKMGQTIAELTQLLEVRETQIVELRRRSTKLVNDLEELKSKVSEDDQERMDVFDNIRRVTEDFEKRLSSAEKRYQQVLAERNGLLAQLEAAKSYQDAAQQLKEQETIIAELRTEGEKLSRQLLQQSNVIKKLRSKEKEDEQQIKSLKEKFEEQLRQVECLKRDLTAIEELKTNQTETMSQLTVTNSQLEKELEANKFVIRGLHEERDALQTALTEAKKELAVLSSEAEVRNSTEMDRMLSVEVSLRQELQLEYESSRKLFEEEKQALTLRCSELVNTLARVDGERSKEKDQTRDEISRLMQRLQEAEARSEELSQALTTATRPLLRQIDTLQLALSSQRTAEERSENIFERKFETLQRQFQAISEKEAVTKDLYLTSQARVDELTERLSSTTKQKDELSTRLDEEEQRIHILEIKLEKENSSSQLIRKELEEEIRTLRSELHRLERSRELQLAEWEEERRKSAMIIERLQRKDDSSKAFQPTDYHLVGAEKSASFPSDGTVAAISRSSSPTPSLSKLSLSGSFSESHSSNPWISSDEVFDRGNTTPTPRCTLYDTMRNGSYAAVFEHLQSQLKTRDDEVLQLQQELQNRERTRDGLANELALTINSNQELHRRLAQVDNMQHELEDLKTKYNALLQMYGEKIEENEELRLDLADVKDMYKAQIDQLMTTSTFPNVGR